MKRPKVHVPGGVLQLRWNGRSLVRWSWKRQLLERLLPVPFSAPHLEYSLIASLEGEAQPSERLISVAIQAIQHAREISLDEVDRRVPPGGTDRPSRWPGSHYRLLAALVAVLQPRCVVEVGTAQGYSALALKYRLPSDGLVATFDLVGWQQYPQSCFTQADFADQRLIQYTDDLSDPAAARRHHDLLSRAELIFLDAAKDGVTEPQLLANLQAVPFVKPSLLVLDDIRIWNMLKVWRDISYPKLDLTSFGHWSGTGLVEWLGK